MKKFVSYLAVAALVLSSAVVFAQQTPAPAAGEELLVEKTLIDFTKLDDAAVNPEIQLNKWRIKLSGLSDNPTSRKLSGFNMVQVTSAEVNEPAKSENIAKAFGVRINFAQGYNNDWAQIRTEDPISEFRVKEEQGMGVLRNVGPIKKVSLMVRGLNYLHSVELRMVDRDGNYKNINFGSFYFNGWKRLTWINPDYIADKRKRDVVKLHLYPAELPLLKFDSLVVYKSSSERGGDFIFYVTDAKVEFEPYFTKEIKDIDNEAVWGIQEAGNASREAREDLLRFLKYSGSSNEEEYLKEEAARQQTKQQAPAGN
jgi:hypothetical protein